MNLPDGTYERHFQIPDEKVGMIYGFERAVVYLGRIAGYGSTAWTRGVPGKPSVGSRDLKMTFGPCALAPTWRDLKTPGWEQVAA